jgi:phosphate transport system protein
LFPAAAILKLEVSGTNGFLKSPRPGSATQAGLQDVSKHLERDIEALEQQLLAMSAQVEGMIAKAWQALSQRHEQLAKDVIEADEAVDQLEVRIEEECLKILALHQPVAIDLRRTATILKVNNDLERIADLAVNIAERALRLNNSMGFEIPPSLRMMADSARVMLANALTALVRLDPNAALQVCDADDEVDRYNAEVVADLYHGMVQDPDSIAPSIHCLAVARHVERIGDLATNIAEDVVYLVQGDIVRHRQSVPATFLPHS